MANIVFDFLHNYETGERRESEPANAYQYDEGHVLEAVLPAVATSVELHYWIRGMEEAEAYTPTSITPNADGSCTILGNIPNKYFETNGELRVYIVVTDGDASITTYEGKLHICQRSMPDDYVDDDPENEATRILTEAQAAATTATQQAQAASDSAGQAQQSAETLSGSVAQIATNTADISTLKEDKADINGYYEDMTVGNAEQLVSSQYVEDSVPYLFRTTGGSADVGNRANVDAIVGGSIVWNQLAPELATANYTFNNSTATAQGDALRVVPREANVQINFGIANNIAQTPVKGHKYFIHEDVKITTNAQASNYAVTLDFSSYVYPRLTVGTFNSIDAVFNCTSDANKLRLFNYPVGTSGVVTSIDDVVDFKNVIITDLTQMFGSTIADYIYSLEQATAGAGVAWFKKLFPNMDAEYSYHEDSFDEESPLITKKLRDYQPGILLSIEGLASHDTVGFNQWDEEVEIGGVNENTGDDWETNDRIRSKNFIPVLPNTVYYFKAPSTIATLAFYDADKNFISALTSISANYIRTTPANAWYIRFNMPTSYGTTYNHDICINLSWSGWRNGEYEAYKKHSYPLDDSLTLRGIPKLDAQNNLYYDGDEYLPDGTVNRRYGVVDLGTLSWKKDTAGTSPTFWASLSLMKKSNPNGKMAKYTFLGAVGWGTFIDSTSDKISALSFSTSSPYVMVKDSDYTDAASFKTAMLGVMLLYELETPTTETADPYQEVQICNDWGTEEFVFSDTAFPVPVGHETRYPANLRDKLQHLPDLADDDGYYMISQSNKQMHLELFRIPKAPTSPDGTYVLKATVSGGTPTYTWEAQV